MSWAGRLAVWMPGLVACNALSGVSDLRFEPDASAGGTSPSTSVSTSGATNGSGGIASAGGEGGSAGAPGGAGGGGGGLASAGGASGGGGGPPAPVPTCDEQYGAVLGYVLCERTASDCRFHVTPAAPASCAIVCSAFGGECLGGWDNLVPDPCKRGAGASCSNTFSSAICDCSHGCGGGPPCPQNETCSGGSCT